MFRKILPILAISLWAISGSAEDVDEKLTAGCQQECQKPACRKPCPPKPCAKPCPKPCAKPCPPKPCPPKPCCKPPAPCCWNFNPCNPKGCTDMNCDGFFFMADFIYWRAENHGFSYAYELETTVPSGLNVGKVVRLPSEWDPGFRIGAGWNTTYDFWDVFVNYTWYRNNASKSKSNSVNGFIPLWPVSTSATGLFNTVKGSTKFVMNMGDLELGRMLFLTKTVAIRPHWGARGGTLHQKFKSTFTAPVSGGANTEQQFAGTNNFWGVGPRAGVNGEFHLDEGFSIRGNLAGALLYGKTNARSQTSVLPSDSSTFTVQPDYTDNFYQLTPHLQLAIGFQWQTCFWCEKMFFKMGLLWETNYWWNQFNLPVGLASTTAPLPSVGNQPLSMEGLTVNFEWDF